jgi:hypothetical protein
MTTVPKIVAITDTHLGQFGADGLGQYSLLSTRAPLNRVQAFVDAVRIFADGEPITLVVSGDLLDLSLAYFEDAVEDLRALLSALAGVVTLEEIVHVVGNHDQHIWSLHSEDRRFLAPLREGRVPTCDATPTAKAAYHVTSRSGEPHVLLQPLVDRIFSATTAPKATLAYPSYERRLTDDVVLYATHGHLFGGIYTELSSLVGDKLKGLPHDRAVATVNQPLVELVYWLLGETGEGVGADGLVETIYTDMQRGSISRLRNLVGRLVEQILPHGVLWRVLGSLERRIVVDAVMRALSKILLSPSTSSATSADRFADLETTRDGLRAWLTAIEWPAQTQSTVAIYGHTHVWDDWQIPDTRVHSWNLATWLVEPDHPPPRAGFLAIHGADARWVDV